MTKTRAGAVFGRSQWGRVGFGTGEWVVYLGTQAGLFGSVPQSINQLAAINEKS
jgi:hypothetical protein